MGVITHMNTIWSFGDCGMMACVPVCSHVCIQRPKEDLGYLLLCAPLHCLRQSFTEPLQLGWRAGKCLGSACLHPRPCWGYRGITSHAQLPPWVLGIQTLSRDCSSVFFSLALKKCILKSVKVSRDQKV